MSKAEWIRFFASCGIHRHEAVEEWERIHKPARREPDSSPAATSNNEKKEKER